MLVWLRPGGPAGSQLNTERSKGAFYVWEYDKRPSEKLRVCLTVFERPSRLNTNSKASNIRSSRVRIRRFEVYLCGTTWESMSLELSHRGIASVFACSGNKCQNIRLIFWRRRWVDDKRVGLRARCRRRRRRTRNGPKAGYLRLEICGCDLAATQARVMGKQCVVCWRPGMCGIPTSDSETSELPAFFGLPIPNFRSRERRRKTGSFRK